VPIRSRFPNWAEMALDALPVHLAILDLDGTILKVNTSWRAFAAGNGEDAGQRNEGANYLSVCDRAQGPGSEGAATFGAGIRAVSQGLKEAFELEYPCQGPDGDHWFQGKVTRFLGGDQRYYLLVAHTDITERRKAEDTLRRNQAMLARTEEAVQLGSWAWDVDTDTVTWSAELFRILQVDPAFGAPPLAEQGRIYQPDDMARLRQAVAQAIAEGRPYDLELTVIRPEGEARLCAARGNPERGPDGKVHFLHGWLQDITERKRAEAALRESEEHYRMLFESAFMGVALLEVIPDAQGQPRDFRFLRANETMAGRSGRRVADLLNRSSRELFPDAEPIWMRFLRVAATGEPDHFEQFIPATQMHLDFHVKLIKPGLIVVITEDVTERKHAERLHLELEGALRSQAAQLLKAQEEERLKVSREIHDDLGQLLTALKLDVGWLARKLAGPGLPREVKALADRAVHAASLTDGVLATVQRIATELRPSLVDQLGLEGALRQEVRQLQARSGLASAVVPDGPFPEVPDRFRGELFQICREALTNVLRHAQATRVKVGWRQEGGTAVFTVTDDGLGMGAVDLASSPAVGLTGMRERAAVCGGTLTFEPVLPQGTKVTVRLPLAGAGTEGGVDP